MSDEVIGVPDVGVLWEVRAAVFGRMREYGSIAVDALDVHWRVSMADWDYLMRINVPPWGAVADPGIFGDDEYSRPPALFGVPVRIVEPPAEQTYPELVVPVTWRTR